MSPEEAIPLMYAFLERIGVPFREAAIEGETFLPGLTIENGALVIDRAKLLYPGDILHEAGHIALTKPSLRPLLSQEILDKQPAHQSEELGVCLWSYLAAKELGLPPSIVFHAAGYKGDSDSMPYYCEQGVGMPLLQWMGVCSPQGDVVSWLRIGGE